MLSDNHTALEVAREAMVLLKNDKEILPLDEKKIKTIAVIGENVQVNFAKGYSSKKHENIEGLSQESIEAAEKFENQKLIDEALEVAKCADAVAFVGG